MKNKKVFLCKCFRTINQTAGLIIRKSSVPIYLEHSFKFQGIQSKNMQHLLPFKYNRNNPIYKQRKLFRRTLIFTPQCWDLNPIPYSFPILPNMFGNVICTQRSY